MPRWLSFALLPLYPAAVYFGSRYFPAPVVALALLPMLLMRGGMRLPGAHWVAVGAAVLAMLTVLSNDVLPLKLYPVLVNAIFLILFAASLRHPPSVIERIARLHEPDLSHDGVAYTRKVTQVWCGFFLANGAIALWTSLWGSDQAWFWYNGVIAYGLIGLLFTSEWLVRRRARQGMHQGGRHG